MWLSALPASRSGRFGSVLHRAGALVLLVYHRRTSSLSLSLSGSAYSISVSSCRVSLIIICIWCVWRGVAATVHTCWSLKTTCGVGTLLSPWCWIEYWTQVARPAWQAHTHVHTHVHIHTQTCTRTHVHTHAQRKTNKKYRPPTTKSWWHPQEYSSSALDMWPASTVYHILCAEHVPWPKLRLWSQSSCPPLLCGVSSIRCSHLWKGSRHRFILFKTDTLLKLCGSIMKHWGKEKLLLPRESHVLIFNIASHFCLIYVILFCKAESFQSFLVFSLTLSFSLLFNMYTIILFNIYIYHCLIYIYIYHLMYILSHGSDFFLAVSSFVLVAMNLSPMLITSMGTFSFVVIYIFFSVENASRIRWMPAHCLSPPVGQLVELWAIQLTVRRYWSSGPAVSYLGRVHHIPVLER